MLVLMTPLQFGRIYGNTLKFYKTCKFFHHTNTCTTQYTSRQVAAILKQLLFTYTGKSGSRFTQVTLFIHYNTFVRDGFISLCT